MGVLSVAVDKHVACNLLVDMVAVPTLALIAAMIIFTVVHMVIPVICHIVQPI